MKLDKAIEILNLNLKHAGVNMPHDCRDAIKLSIEAINYIIRLRACSLQHRGTRLSGETPRTSETFPDETLNKLRESPLGTHRKG